MEGSNLLTGRTIDLVTYTLLIDGEAVSREYGILSISVSREINRIPWAKIVIRDGDVSKREFMASNSELFVPGKEIEIKAGYHSNNETLFKGIIIRHGVKVGSDGNSTLELECKDKAVKMTASRKSAHYANMKDSDLIDELIDGYDLTSEVDDTSFEHPEMVKYNCTDWDFMITRAEANGLLTIVDDGTITVTAPDVEQEPQFVVTYGHSIIEFEAKMDASTQLSNVTGKSWDHSNQEVAEEGGEAPEYEGQGNFSASNLADVMHSEDEALYHGGDLKSEQLQSWANARLIRSRLAKIIGRIRIQGMQNIKPNQLITIEGIGERFNGNAFVSGVVHQIYQGRWTTDLQLGLSPEWFSGNKDIVDTQASGLVPSINGLHIAKVVQIGKDEQEGDHRVKVKIPFVNQAGATDSDGVWARMANVFAGNNRGMVFRPEIDDEVVIGFLNDDPRDPIVLGALHSSVNPAPQEASDDNHEKGIYTRGEMQFVFNDDDKTITISTKNGNSVLLSEKEGGITLTDENDNTIKLNSDGITIESAKDLVLKATGDVKMEGTNIEQSAQANLKASGSAVTEISASGNTVIKGAVVQIN